MNNRDAQIILKILEEIAVIENFIYIASKDNMYAADSGQSFLAGYLQSIG